VASVHRKSGASGKESPYWNAKFKGPHGTVWTLTTELREKKPARSLARAWERTAETGYNGHLTHAKAQKFLAECAEITRGDGYRKSEEFLDECLRISTGSGLNIPTAERYFRDWLEAKEQLGRTSESTVTRYAPILNRFVAFLPDIRRRFPLASITASDIDGKQDLAQQWRESRNAESECVTGQLEGSCDETQQAVLVQAELALE